MSISDAINYTTGWLRHVTLGYDKRRVDGISGRYSQRKIDFYEAKKQLLFAGFQPPIMAEIFLLTLDNEELFLNHIKLIGRLESKLQGRLKPQQYQ